MKMFISALCIVLFAVLVGAPLAHAQQSEAKPQQPAPQQPAAAAKAKPTPFKPISDEQLKALLARRVKGGFVGHSFRGFANMFLVSSMLNLGHGVGLMTESPEIAKHEFSPGYPDFYEPTLHEFLDSIALQTGSEWKFEKTGKFVQSDAEVKKPIEGLAIFEFTKAKRAKPYDLALAAGWKAEDQGNWVMHVPPTFPVGLDIYELGTFTADDTKDQANFMKELPKKISLEWAQRVSATATEKQLTAAHVGKYDALHFDTLVESQVGKKIRWRQWVFVADDRAYFVVSTILPELEAKIYPDVQAMLKTFGLKKK